MKIKGGAHGIPANPLDRDDEGIFISHINDNGAASRDGRLKPGMRIIEVNDQSLLGVTHQDAVQVLRNQGNRIRVLVCDGYDPNTIHNNVNEAATNNIRLNNKDLSSNFSTNITPENPDDDDVFAATMSPTLSPNKERKKTTTVIMKKHQTSVRKI